MKIQEETDCLAPIKNMSNPRICIFGAGISGICAGVQLQKKLGIHDFTIFEKRDDFGGVWLAQTYPGAACDVPSYLYSYSFEPNPNWSTSFASQPEIRDYLQGVAKKHDLYSKAKFGHEVTNASWDELTKTWKVIVHDIIRNRTEELTYDIIIMGVGVFTNPKVPEEVLSFKGPMIHSGKWDPSIDLENKVVAIVGSGPSAVQIIPEILPKVKKLISFQRNPAWVPPKPLFSISPTVRTLIRVIPGLHWLLRLIAFLIFDVIFLQVFKTGTNSARLGDLLGRKMIETQISDPEIRKKLIPDYIFGCKQGTLSSVYFKAFADSKKAEVVREHIVGTKDKTIITGDGREYEVDVLILATGYKVSEYWAPMVFCGRGLRPGQDAFAPLKAKGLPHYLGIVVNSLPNVFFLLGPNTGLGHNSVIFSIECSMEWICNVIKEKMQRDVKVVSVKKEAEDEYRSELNEKLKEFVWGTENCSSWHHDEYGNNIATYPGSLRAYWKETKKVDFSKLNFEQQ